MWGSWKTRMQGTKNFNNQEQRIPPLRYRQNIQSYSNGSPDQVTFIHVHMDIRISYSCKVYIKRLYDHLRGQRGGHLCLTVLTTVSVVLSIRSYRYPPIEKYFAGTSNKKPPSQNDAEYCRDMFNVCVRGLLCEQRIPFQ